MEEHARNKQYEYRANSNLVLITNDRDRVRNDGVSTEVQSLAKYSTTTLIKQMGDRAVNVVKASSAELDERVAKSKKKRQAEEKEQEAHKKAKRSGGVTSVLSAEVDTTYRPQTRETRAAYETLLNLIQHEMGDKPHDVLRSAADEVLAILKEERPQHSKKKELESLFRSKNFDDTRFAKFVNVSKAITDYKTDGNEPESQAAEPGDGDAAGVEGDVAKTIINQNAIDQQLSVPVVFDEEEKEDEDGTENLDEIKDDDELEDEEQLDVMEDDEGYAIETKAGDAGNLVDEEEARENEIDVRTIDAHWIQRQTSTFYKDPHISQKLADDIYVRLSSSEADGAVENALVHALGYDKFNFIKKLMRHRWKIVYCIRLARAADAKERAEIENQMQADVKLRPILEALKKTTTAAERNIDLEKKLLAEARNLGLARKEEQVASGLTTIERTTEAFWKRPKALLDLDSLVFQDGSHHMTNTDCKLPKSAEIISKKGYQEVHIPALKAPERAQDKRVAISDMPAWAQPAFAGMQELNRVQSQVYETAMFSAENMLMCAPTGAGKTNVAMLTMLREIGLHQNADGTINTEAFKIIYVAPMKSLVQEMVLNFSKRLEPYGIQVKELSGDQQLSREQIQSTQVIVTTPEKWDIITRKSGDRTYTELVKLLIIDEIHLLHDSRGPVLESIVARTIRQIESTQELVRLVGLSATLPNYEDVAMFLRVKKDKGLFFFDNSFRPCPLQQVYVGITAKKAFKRFELMNELTYEKVSLHAGKNQILVFVHSRKETASTARTIRDLAMEKDELVKFIKDDEARRALLTSEAENVKNQSLRELLPYGFAIHHAGMSRGDRTLVEELFADGHIQVLVSTATLAWGVNLPAHTVIIKGTQVYSPEKGSWTELSPLDVMQMMGRAGRPQYDTYGEGYIITTQRELHYYLSLLNEQLPIESQFLAQLADHLNAEIVLGSVSNVKEAVQWLGYTYLYIRMLRKPQLYGISHEQIDADPYLEQRRIDLIHTAATLLDKHHLIKYDRKTGQFQITDLGRVASHYYISHTSIAQFNEYLKPNMSDIELFRVFSLSSEFKNMQVREEEKMELAKLLDKVPIPVKESIEEPSAKTNVLLQAYISRLTLEGFALVSDMVYITQSAGRIMRALFEIVLKRGWASVAVKCLNIVKMVAHRMWSAQSPLHQFTGIPEAIIKKLEGKEYAWERLYDLDAHYIGELVRMPKIGKAIHKAIHQVPRLELQGHVQPVTRSVLRVELTLTPDFQWDPKLHGYAEPFWIIVEDVDGETILHYEYFLLKQRFATQEHSVNFSIPIFDPLPPQYYIRVVSDRWLGSEVVLPISFRRLILPEKYAPPTELLDLQPLPITDLANERFINYYANQFEHFNPIQTQVFQVLYRRNDNALVAAPTGSGKTVCAELAIMRMLSQDPRAKVVYMVPMEALAIERLADWRPRMGKHLQINVVMLTGEAGTDTRLLNEGQVIITTPERWDVISRRWRTRKQIQDVKLFIADELHLIGAAAGPTMEVVVSRMRYIASETKAEGKLPLRIVGLSTSVANAKDLGEWIGATSSTLFNFHPNVRPVPLEIRIQGFDHTNFDARELAMIKPAYTNIIQHSPDKPIIVFVSGRKQARRVAIDLMTYASGEDTPNRFLHADPEDIKPHLNNIANATLRETIMSGIAFYHEGMTDIERAIVEKLFKAGALQVVVAEYSLAWGMSMAAHMVLIMGTQSYSSAEHRYIDCPITDVVQMMGRASRPTIDASSKVVLFCESSKKEFYKKFLYQPFPIESHLDHQLADHLNAEIITKRIETVQDAVDFLTWTFLYRRITQNPNYYNLQGVSHRHFSDHLSELVENTLDDLQQAKCITVEDETEVAPLNLGMIAAYYYIKYTTVELFSRSLQQKTKLKGILEILSAASEFESIPVRHREELTLRKLANHLPLKVSGGETSLFTDVPSKINILLQTHFSRIPLPPIIAQDQAKTLPDANRLLQAMVDVLSSAGWLTPALACMELSQMVTQGLWNTDSPLLQLPHMTSELVSKCNKAKIETISDLMEMEDDAERNELLGLSPAKMQDIAMFCNNYPDIELTFSIQDKNNLSAGEKVVVKVNLKRDPDDDEADELDGVPRISAPRYPQPKTEGWWLVLGIPEKNELVSIKRVNMAKRITSVALDFVAPDAGKYQYKLFFMSDSYLNVDQEFTLDMTFGAAKEGDAMSDDE